MNNLFELLSSTREVVSISINAAGFQVEISSYVINTDPYLDGLMLYFEDENMVFLSSFNDICTEENDEKGFTYVLKNIANDVVITIQIPK